MKSLVVYDSVYGNTEEIAKAIGAALGEDTKVVKADQAGKADLESVQLLIVGSPTYGGRPTPGMREFLKKIEGASLKGTTVAGFDTRAQAKIVQLFGFAAGKIENSLKKLGGTPVVNPEGFFVTGTQGPLAESEGTRAGNWAKDIAAKCS